MISARATLRGVAFDYRTEFELKAIRAIDLEYDVNELRPAITESLVRQLVAAQFPQWANLPVTRVVPGGWDNRTFRLGDDMLVRLPSATGYVPQVEKEHRWLPRLAPHLPFPIPVPLAIGTPGFGYPFPWSIYRWIEGERAIEAHIADHKRFATDVAQFLVALQRMDASDGPAAGAHSFFRGGPLEVYDTESRNAIAALDGQIDTGRATAAWEAALAAPWYGPSMWVHGDMAPGNLLVRDGRLCAVLDFGCSAVGDPACDLVLAWTFLSGESREAFRAALPLDAGTWARGRGWALWKALIVAAGQADTSAPEAATSRQTIDEVLADHPQAR